jgi:hypothetical protein
MMLAMRVVVAVMMVRAAFVGMRFVRCARLDVNMGDVVLRVAVPDSPNPRSG